MPTHIPQGVRHNNLTMLLTSRRILPRTSRTVLQHVMAGDTQDFVVEQSQSHRTSEVSCRSRTATDTLAMRHYGPADFTNPPAICISQANGYAKGG